MTFNTYIDYLLEQSYIILLKRHSGNASAKTVDEFYDELIRQHKEYMFGNPDDERQIPLWMNRRNYQELYPVQAKKNNRSKFALQPRFLAGFLPHVAKSNYAGTGAYLLSGPQSEGPSASLKSGKSDEQLKMVADFLRRHGFTEANAESIEFIKNNQSSSGVTISGDLSLYGIASSLTPIEMDKINTMLSPQISRF